MRDHEQSPRISSIATAIGDEVVYDGFVNGKEATLVLDSGASHLFMSKSSAEKCGVQYTPVGQEIELGDRSVIRAVGQGMVLLNVNGVLSNESVYVLDMVDPTEEPRVIVGHHWCRRHNPNVNWTNGVLQVKKPDGKMVTIRPRTTCKTKPVIKQVSIKQLRKLVRKKGTELFAVKVTPKMAKLVCKDEFEDLIQEFDDIFVDELPAELPPRRECDFEIKLKSDMPPPVRPVIRLSNEELKELKKQLQFYLEKGFIRPSASPYGAPVFFVKKKSGELRLVCDYRALNKITIPDKTPLPLISEAMDQVAGATIFSQIDLIGAYHQMRIQEVDIPKTAIRTRFGSYEWTVLCFGLTNAPAAFTRLLATLLQELNGECLVLFLDDLLIYSRSIEEHKHHLRRLFEILRNNKLYCKRSKCVIGAAEVSYLGHRVSKNGIAMESRLVNAVLEWPQPKDIRDVQSFLGLANYYRKFIRGYANIVRPITDLLRGKDFKWEQLQEDAFAKLKEALTSAPVLAHPSPDKVFHVNTDASQYAVGAALEQDGHPIAFLSHRLNEQEQRWDTGDQELYGFMLALREWSVYLRGNHFVFKTDHQPIVYLQSKARLTGRQARWLDEIQSYSFEVQHVKGTANVVPDALSRRADHRPQLGSIKETNSTLITRIAQELHNDEVAMDLVRNLENPDEESSTKVAKSLRNFKYDGKFLLWTGSTNVRLYVPNSGTLRHDVFRQEHNTSHFGIHKTYNRMATHFYWNRMFHDVEKWVSSCHECQINKQRQEKTGGLLQPLPIPERCWDTVCADFLTGLPETKSGHDAILVIVDKLSKRGIFIPTKKTLSAPEAAVLFQDYLFSKHGTPVTIITDRDPKFKGNFWRSMAQQLNIKLNMSTASHPQTDGQSENLIRTLSGMLRGYIQKDEQNWDTVLSILEFEYNSTKHNSTQLSPFEVDIGYVPHTPTSRAIEQCTIQSQSAIDVVEKRKAFQRVAKDCMRNAQTTQKHYADVGRRDISYDVGDLVLLKSQDLDTFNRSTLPIKWRPKYLGPLRVLEVMGPVTYRLELPASMKRAHNVFHVSKLKKYVPTTSDSRNLDVVIDASGTVEQEVERILDKKRMGRRVFYLVLFSGDAEHEAIWMPKSELKHCKDIIAEFELFSRTKTSKKGVSVT